MGITMKHFWSVPGNRGASLFSRKGRTYSPPRRGRWYCLRQPCALRGGCGFRSNSLLLEALMDNATALRCCCHCPHRRLLFLHRKQQPPACENSAKNKSFGYVPQLLRSYGYRFSCDTHFLFAEKKQKQKGR